MKGNNYSVSLFLPLKVFLKGTNLSPVNITINLSGGTQFRMRIKEPFRQAKRVAAHARMHIIYGGEDLLGSQFAE